MSMGAAGVPADAAVFRHRNPGILPSASCGTCDREPLWCRYYYQVGDGTTFSTTYNFTTFADVSKGA